MIIHGKKDYFGCIEDEVWLSLFPSPPGLRRHAVERLQSLRWKYAAISQVLETPLSFPFSPPRPFFSL